MSIPHLQVANNFAVLLVILCITSFCWNIGTCTVIFAVYFRHGKKARDEAERVKSQHVALVSLSYILMMTLTVGAMLWDLYHYSISCFCFPLPVRVVITIPALLSGNLALWKMLRYQFRGLFAAQNK